MSAHDFARILQVPLLLTVATSALLSRSWRSSLSALAPVDRGLLVALIGFVAASCLHADLPWVAAREVALDVSLLFVATVLAAQLRSPEARDRALTWLTVGTTAYSLLWLINLSMAAASGDAVSPWDLLFGFDNPRFFNHVQTVVLPLVAVVAVSPRSSRLLKAAAGMAIVLGGAMLFVVLARASTLGLVAGGVAAYCMGHRHARRYMTVLLGGLAAGALLMFVAWEAWLSRLGGQMAYHDLGQVHFRDYLAHRALDMCLSSPWLGVGPMHFSHASNPIAAHPHNIYAQLLAELGVPAVLLIGVLVFRGLQRRFHSLCAASATEPALAAGLVGATVAMLIDGAFSGNFVMPLSQLAIVLLLALLNGVHSEQRGAGRAASAMATSRDVQMRGVGGWLLVCLLTVPLTVVTLREGLPPSDPQIRTGHPRLEATGEQFLNPRFWAHGWF